MQNNANEMAVFNTAIYVRLSKEDIVAAQSGRESNSITNQKQLILDFLKDKPEFNIVSIRIDDGYTGTNFDRPAFQRMLNDIKAGRINCVVVKDLSRFGREYINSGKYIHRLFPVLGVRLIAINDNIDTITRDESSEFSITLKNLMNDNYSRDISVKVRSQLQVKRKHGDFICPFAPYGYQKCEGNHNRIEPDPYAATVVQDIFNWKIQGMTNNGIAIRLAESGILAPLEYKRHKGEPLFSGFKMKERCEWTAQAVARILTNPIYIGTLRQGLRRRPNYKIKKSIPTEENEWVVIHDAHEPVVTKRTFYLAQKALLIDTRAAPRATTVYPLSGLLECGECGNAVTRSTINNGYKLYSYFRCSVRTKEDRCELKQVPEAQVEAAVLQLLQEHISAVVELDRCLSEIQQVPYQKINVAKCEQRREKLAAEIARYRDLKASLYEDMKEGLISKTDFCDIRGQYDARIADALIAQEQIDRELSTPSSQTRYQIYETQIDDAKRKIEKFNQLKAALYGDFADGLLSHQDYTDLSEDYSRRADDLRIFIAELEKEKEKYSAGFGSKMQWALLIEKYKDQESLDAEMAAAFIETLTLFNDGHVEVAFRHRDEIEQVLYVAATRGKEAERYAG